MSIALARSNGVGIMVCPQFYEGQNSSLWIERADQEDLLQIDMGLAIAEIDYSWSELQRWRPEAAVMLRGFHAYVASLRPRLSQKPYGLGVTMLRAGEDFRRYRIPELPTIRPIDWCGVLVDPTDFLCATQYILTTTPLAGGDPRLPFVQMKREQLITA